MDSITHQCKLVCRLVHHCRRAVSQQCAASDRILYGTGPHAAVYSVSSVGRCACSSAFSALLSWASATSACSSSVSCCHKCDQSCSLHQHNIDAHRKFQLRIWLACRMKDALCAGLTEVRTSPQLKACAQTSVLFAASSCHTALTMPAAVTKVQEHLY
eukprot:6404-Heterococcus_DN1.PRE.1